MVSFCTNRFNVILLLLGFIFKSEEKELIICFKRNTECFNPTYILSSNNGLIQRISMQFETPGRPTPRCCSGQTCDIDWVDECEDKNSCQFTNLGVQTMLEENCFLSTALENFRVRVYYNCSVDKSEGESKVALPVAGNPDNTGGEGVTSAVVVPIIVVLAILMIVTAIFGIVIYRRKSGQNNRTDKQTDSTGIENAGLDDEYTTIPADIGCDDHHTYNIIKPNDSNNFASTEIKRGDSVNYSTIVLNEDTNDTSNTYGYDKTNQKTRYDPRKEINNEGLNSYGHFSDQLDDYNRIVSSDCQHNDRNYSHLVSEKSFDYSHLNDKHQISGNISENEYNHLQTKPGPIRRVDSYEKPNLKRHSLGNDGMENWPNSNFKISNMQETPCMDGTNDNSTKRKDSYRNPAKVNSENHVAVNSELEETLKPRDDFEVPIALDTLNGVSSGRMKRRDSYEQPIELGSAGT